MKTLVLANQKGGVGKTAVATLVAQYLAEHGRRVLAIDLDHQGNFTTPLLLSRRAVRAEATADRLLTATAPPALPDARFVVVPADSGLMLLERQAALHSPFANALRAFLERAAVAFDVCVIDTNPNPDIRLIAALACCDYVLSPIQLNQEALDGVATLLNHERVGLHRITAVLNPRLRLLGLLPTMVESNPYQRANFVQVAERYGKLLIRDASRGDRVASIPKRSAIAESQGSGEVLWTMKKSAARETWSEVGPVIACIASAITGTADVEPADAPAA